jgi:hypothetical protein
MKKFIPSPKINVPRWLETIIQCCLFLAIISFVHYFGLDKIIMDTDLFNYTRSKVLSILITLLLYYFYKVLGTHTAVDLIEIDFENKNVIFVYWLFYFKKKTLKIKFEELSYKRRNDITILGGSLSVRIYQNGKFKIKLNSRNGWKDKQIDEIIAEFLLIKPPTVRSVQ